MTSIIMSGQPVAEIFDPMCTINKENIVFTARKFLILKWLEQENYPKFNPYYSLSQHIELKPKVHYKQGEHCFHSQKVV